MRKIKFRAWGPNSKYMWAWEELIANDTSMRWMQPSFGEKVLMQFTGLKDKNGKEIYEGDICEISNTWTVFKREVIFKDAGFGFQGTNGMFIPNKELMEIIGNIHENPELLA